MHQKHVVFSLDFHTIRVIHTTLVDYSPHRSQQYRDSVYINSGTAVVIAWISTKDLPCIAHDTIKIRGCYEQLHRIRRRGATARIATSHDMLTQQVNLTAPIK
jgi:hypothetical protein